MRRLMSIILPSLLLATAGANPQPTVDVGQQTQINLCALPGTVQGVDLIACSLKYTGLGEITFSVKNRGNVAVNTPLAPGDMSQPVKKATPSGPPIQFDLYQGNQLILSLFQPALGPGQSKTFTAKIPSNYATPKCAETKALKFVIDPKNQIAEVGEGADNTLSLNATRPCPDLAIKSIKRDAEGLFNETYRVKVTIINQGNAPSPSTQVWGTSLPTGIWPLTGWPELVPTHTLKALEPGETTSFKVGGSVLATSRTAVRIMLDRFFQIEELEEGNNTRDEWI